MSEGMEGSISSHRRATKAATVSALSLKKRKTVGGNKEEKLQGLVTRGRRLKLREEKDNSTGVRQTCRRVNLKKCEDFVYGNTKVATYKLKRKSPPITTKHTLKGGNKEKKKSLSAFNQDDEHVRIGHFQSRSGKKVMANINKGDMHCTDASLVSEKNDSFLDNSEVCTRRNLKRKLKIGDESKADADEIAARKVYRITKNLKDSNRGKIAKDNEHHVKNESMVKADIAKGKDDIRLYPRNRSETKVHKQKCGNEILNSEKCKTGEESGNEWSSNMPPSEMDTSCSDEQDKDQDKSESATNEEDVENKRRTFKEVEVHNDVQKELKVTSEVDDRSKTRTRSARKVKKNIDKDFEYYESEPLRRKTSLDVTQNDTCKEKNLMKDKKLENVNNFENLIESEYTEPDLDSVKDTPGTDACDKVLYTDVASIKCFVCNLSFSGRENYAKHIRELHKTLIPCEHCDSCFETKTEMCKHLEESHNGVDTREGKHWPNVFKCTFEECPMAFSGAKHLQRHINSIHLNIKYECEFCGICYKQISSLKNHLTIQHSNEVPTKTFDECVVEKQTSCKCPYKECSKEFNNMSNRKKHIDAVHLNLRNFQCEYCEHRFKTSSALKFHIAARHTSDADKKLYECDVCKKTFLRKAGLQLHETLHTDTKGYSCSFKGCGKSFRLKSNLTKHEKIHNDIKPYRCDVCEERFSRKTYLDTHMYKHTGVKDYTCDICQKSFSQKGNLMTHKLLHNRERTIYKCPRCTHTFNFKSNMKKHLQSHTTHLGRFNEKFENVSEEIGISYTGNSKLQPYSDDISVPETVKCTTGVIGSVSPTTKLKGNFGAFKPNKIWLTQNVLSSIQNGAKPVVLIVKPFKSPHNDKVIEKDIESVSTANAENILDNVTVEKDKESSNDCSILTPSQQRSVACNTGQNSDEIQVDSVNGKSDGLMVDQVTVADSDYMPYFNTRKAYGKDIESVGPDRSNPVYVCIEDVTQQVSHKSLIASTTQNEISKFPKSGIECPVLAEKNPTFMIEFDINGVPMARLKETEQSLGGESRFCASHKIDKTTSEIVESEHMGNDIVKVACGTNENVETASELLALNDSVQRSSVENLNRVVETVNISALPSVETETVFEVTDNDGCDDMIDLPSRDLNTDFQQHINEDKQIITTSYNQNECSLLNRPNQYSAVQNICVPYSDSYIPKPVELAYHMITYPQTAESEVPNDSNALGDVLSNPVDRNELKITSTSDFSVKTDSVVDRDSGLIVTEQIVEETTVENF